MSHARKSSSRRQAATPEPPAPPRGRRRYLDPDRKQDILTLVGEGCTFEEAAEMVGCSARTISREAARHPEFRRSLLRSASRAQEYPLGLMHKAAAREPRAAAWLLERTEPDRYAPRRRGVCDLHDFEWACQLMVEAGLAEIREPDLQRRVQSRMEQAAKEVAKALVTSGVPETSRWRAARGQDRIARLEREVLQRPLTPPPGRQEPAAEHSEALAGQPTFVGSDGSTRHTGGAKTPRNQGSDVLMSGSPAARVTNLDAPDPCAQPQASESLASHAPAQEHAS